MIHCVGWTNISLCATLGDGGEGWHATCAKFTRVWRIICGGRSWAEILIQPGKASFRRDALIHKVNVKVLMWESVTLPWRANHLQLWECQWVASISTCCPPSPALIEMQCKPVSLLCKQPCVLGRVAPSLCKLGCVKRVCFTCIVPFHHHHYAHGSPCQLGNSGIIQTSDLIVAS